MSANTIQELAALAKSKPGTISFAYSARAGGNHMPAELFRRRASLDVLYVPYKGEAEARLDMVKGVVSAGFFYPSGASPQINAGKLRALALAGFHRNRALPDVPTMAQSGFPDCEFTATTLSLRTRWYSRKHCAASEEGGSRDPAGARDKNIIRIGRRRGGVRDAEEVRATYAREHEQSVSLVKALDIKPQ